MTSLKEDAALVERCRDESFGHGVPSRQMSMSEEELCCPVCCDLFQDPVCLSCSHSMCSACIRLFWKINQARECPVCRTPSPTDDPPANLVLSNLCRAVLQERGLPSGPHGPSDPRLACSSGPAKVPASGGAAARGSRQCGFHRSDVSLYCVEEQQTVCVECVDSNMHSTHTLQPVCVAAQDLREDLRRRLYPVKEKLESFRTAMLTCDQMTQHIKNQARHTERLIRDEFERLHQFLRDEEAARVDNLREEEEEKSRKMKRKINEIDREIDCLQDLVSAIERELKAEDVLFLQKYKNTVKRTLYPLQDIERVSGALINVAKHLGNLQSTVWEKIHKNLQCTPVTLDPNTAHAGLRVSDNLLSVHFSSQPQPALPANPERFSSFPCVLGSQGFSAGTHTWEVDVRDSSFWHLGVTAESSPRDGVTIDDGHVWRVWHYSGQYRARFSKAPATTLSVCQPPQRVRVQLDWARGQLAFYDPERHLLLHMFTHRFTETLFPYFFNKGSSLKILPQHHPTGD